MTDKPPRSRRKPAQTSGERLRTAILTEYVLDPGELLLLDQAVSLADALARLNEEVAAERTLTTKSSRGQAVASPLLAAQRQHAETPARLLESLGLPRPEEEEEGELSSTRKARKAALIRWTKEAR